MKLLLLHVLLLNVYIKACTCRLSTYGSALRKKLKQMILNNVVWHYVRARSFENKRKLLSDKSVALQMLHCV